MSSSDRPEARSECSLARLVLGPALLTLSVTLIRLGLELAHAPAWLASRAAGGQGALLGISWLPLFFGPWFVSRIRAPGVTTWSLTKKLAKTLVVYGWSVRLPVVAVTFLAVAMGWDTHFNNFGPDSPQPSWSKIILGTLGAQLIFWSVIWTPIVGSVAGVVFHLFTRGKESRSSGALDRPLGAA